MWKEFNLSTSVSEKGDKQVCHVKIDGYLDSGTFPKLQDYLANLIGKGYYNYVLDLGNLDYISSAGLGVLIGTLREVRDNGGDLKIINMSDKIERIFNLLGFSRLMKVYKTFDEALQAF